MTESDDPSFAPRVRAEVAQSFNDAGPSDQAILNWYFAQPHDAEAALKEAMAASRFTERGVKNRAPIVIRALYERIGESLVPTARSHAELSALIAERNPQPPPPEPSSPGTMVREIARGFSADDPTIYPRTSSHRR
ncbi:MAG: hypothetical protein HOQ05_13110 [Corynebacteriales bacterium]|nr:hypothetical protein [Mycobacteriales bacterium]